MPWNEQGKNQRDPWSGGGGGSGGGGQRPPDLEEMMRKVSQQLNSLFGGKGGGGDSDGGGGSGMGRHSRAVISLALIIALVVWLASGFYIVGEGDRGVVLRFGAFQKISEPGPHWHLPFPFERVEVENVDSIRTLEHRALMLTADENIIDVDIAVQYRVLDVTDFLFNVRQPDRTVQFAMESAIRERVGKSNLDYILGEGRAEIAVTSREVLQSALDSYGAGVMVTSMSMQQAQPPEPVQESFADAIRAREDEMRFINEAEAYRNGLIPRARGQAARILEEAEAYRDQVVARAEGDAARFTQLLVEYQVAPEVTRERLYIEAVEEIFRDSNKLMLDVASTNNLMMLPLDQLFGAAPPARDAGPTPQPLDTSRGAFGVGTPSQAPNRTGTRPDPRAREVR